MKTSLSLFVMMLILFPCLKGQTVLPANMYPDSLHTPFIYGVASGDPLPGSVILWTGVNPDGPTDEIPVNWEVATDSNFSGIIQSGNVIADSASDFTLNVTVSNLNPGTVYYYRFFTNQNEYSVKGRTQTAKTGNISSLNVAVMSCSSIYSGFFNAYRRLGERDVLDCVIHLGDYVYDYADSDEEIRMPVPAHTEPASLSEWRERHKYYLLDPDLRLARQQHPWIALWDNHDLSGKSTQSGGSKAFREYLPVRHTGKTLADTIYRSFAFGDLLDLWICDVSMYRDVDTLPDGSPAIMNTAQSEVLMDGLTGSSAKWKMMGSQKMMGGWYTNGIPQQVLDLVPNDGPVFDNTSWDGYPSSRNQILQTLRSNQIDNFFVLSGDAHVSIAMDLIENPHDSLAYNPETGEGSIGVEFLPASISRGNVDEAGVASFLIPAFTTLSDDANPQHVYSEFTAHGYGLLTISPDSIIARYMYSPILALSNTETNAKTLVVKDGENHWSRPAATDITEKAELIRAELFPNPVHGSLTVSLFTGTKLKIQTEVVSLEGKLLLSSPERWIQGNTQYSLQVNSLTAGEYFLKISSNGKTLKTIPFIHIQD